MIEAEKEVCSMGYTLSFTASVKVQRGGVAGLLHHDARDVDREHGREVRHSNPDIDQARTKQNQTLVSDGKGSWKPCKGTDQIEAAIDARLDAVKKPLRKDAVVLRPIVLQLDPEWYAANTDPKERGRAAGAMFGWAAKTFGADNVVYASVHNDESNPHMHIGICPVTEDGRLSQKDWFKDPKSLREMHQDFRKHMTAAGFDIAMERQKPGKHARRMELDEFKDFKELQKREKAVEAREKAVEARETVLKDKYTEIARHATEAATAALAKAPEEKRQEPAYQGNARAAAKEAIEQDVILGAIKLAKEQEERKQRQQEQQGPDLG